MSLNNEERRIMVDHESKKTRQTYARMRWLLAAATLCAMTAYASPKVGDANSDGDINTADAVAIYNYIIDGERSSTLAQNADLNADGLVNSADVVALYNYIINHTPFWPYFSCYADIMKDENDVMQIAKNSVKSRKAIDFSAKIGTFDQNTTLVIGHGSAGDYTASWIEITASKIVAHVYLNTDKTKIYEHNLNIAKDVNVSVFKDMSGSSASIIIESNGRKYEGTISWIGDNGTTDSIYARVNKGTLHKCTLYWSSRSLLADVWMFGDSYFALDNTARWTYHMVKDGYTDFLFNAFPGAKSAEILQDFKTLLTVAKPQTAIWCLGQNNKDNGRGVKTAETPNVEWLQATQEFISLCKTNGIEPILSTIPTVVGGNTDNSFRYHGAKNEWVRNSGYRYVDFASAVEADDVTGYWHGQGTSEDYLEGNAESTTRVHPTILGAQALYKQFQKDCTDLLQK